MATQALKFFKEKLASLRVTHKLYGEPSQEKMRRFLVVMEGQTKRALVNPPASVRNHVVNAYKEMGYDFATDAFVPGEKPPMVADVDKMLVEMVAYFEKLKAGQGAGRAARPPVPPPRVPEPSADELKDLSCAVKTLFGLDHNNLVPGQGYDLDLQRNSRPYAAGDTAPKKLFEFVNKDELKRPTYAAFFKLLDNYSSATGVAERVSFDEKVENLTFINLVLKSPVGQYAHKYLLAKKKVGRKPAEFKNLLLDIWFKQYARGGRIKDSSGFEHVFMGEDKRGKVSGMHNWLRLWNEELAGRLDYRGHFKPKRRGATSAMGEYEMERLNTIQFTWNGDLKPKSTTLFGISPEFELMLYTLCFLCGEEENVLTCGPYQVAVKCFKWTTHDGKTVIATTFPMEVSWSRAEAASKIQSAVRGRSARRSSKYYKSRR